MKKIIFSLLMASFFLVAVTTPGWAPDPCIDIEKLVSVDGGQTFVDADDCDGAPTTAGPAEYKLIVKNCGNTDLPKVFISDPELGIVDFEVGHIPYQGSKTFTKDDISALFVKDVCELDPEFFDNTATAEDRYWNSTGRNITDSDSACVKCEKLCSIGDYVWEDANRNGCQDDEEGIEGVTVKLFDGCFGDVIATTTTDANGLYMFEGLECGKDYGIQFVDDPDDIYEQTTADQECVDGDPDASDRQDSDCGAEGKVCVPASTLPPGTFNDTIDCGYVCEGVIGDRVWLDSNGNPGCQDTDEPGLRDIEVKLFETCSDPPNPENQVGNSVFTDENGNYQFTELCPGNYLVKFEDPLGRDNTNPGNPCDDGGLEGGGGEGSDSNCGDPELECVELTKDQAVDRTIDCGKLPPDCDISVDKECLVVPPPTTGGDLCDDFDKPQKLTMKYIGGDGNVNSQDSGKVEITGDPGTTSPVYIIAHNKDEPFKDAKIWFSGVVNLNDTFVIDSMNAGEDDLDSETFVYIFVNNGGAPGELLQSIKFHTSCSQPLLLGDIYGAMQLISFTDKNGAGSSLPTTEPQYSDNCTIEQPPASDLCEDFDKPQKLTMEYIGGDGNVNSQDSGKVEISGNPGTTSPVYIIAHNKDEPFKDAKIWFSGVVNLNETFVIDSMNAGENDLDSETFVYIFVNNGGAPGELLQSIKFHTSCSQPLLLGDIYGAMQLIGFIDKNGESASAGNEVKFRYIIRNNGATTAEITSVNDSELGELLQNPPLILGLGESNENDPITASAFISETTTNVVTVSGNVAGIPLSECNAEDEVTVEVVPPPPPRTDLCEDFDKPQKLTMEYIGGDGNVNSQDSGKVEIIGDPGTTSPVYIIAHNKDEPFKSDAKIWFSGVVNLNETFVIDSMNAGEDDLESNTFVYIFEGADVPQASEAPLQSIKFHTSCSQPLLLGDIYGAMQLVGFIDKNGAGSSLP